MCTERVTFIFRHYIAVILIAKLGQRTQNSIFVSILVLHLALTWMGRRSRLLCPSLLPSRVLGKASTVWGGGDREAGGGRWEWVSKGVSLWPSGSTGWHGLLGWGDTHQMPPGCYSKARLKADMGKSRARCPTCLSGTLGTSQAAAPGVIQVCSFAL